MGSALGKREGQFEPLRASGGHVVLVGCLNLGGWVFHKSV